MEIKEHSFVQSVLSFLWVQKIGLRSSCLHSERFTH